jgi:hypothetical protein
LLLLKKFPALLEQRLFSTDSASTPCLAYADDLDEAPALAPMSLGIDLTPSLLQKFEKFEPHFSQFTSPRGNSTDERL